MISRTLVTQERRQHVARGPMLSGIGIALGLALAPAAANASTYRVYTANAASAMTLNASDGFCSLAEAVQHARGNTVYNCTDFAPSSSEQRIELRESANKPFSTNHFTISQTPLTLVRQGIPIRIVGIGTGASIDSTVYSAFIILFKSIGYFENLKLTNTAGSGGGRLIENYGELGLLSVTIANGDVTGPQHTTGRGGGIFNGNTANGLFPAFISFAQNSVITGNKARRGGGIYNDSGIINELSVTISNNTATEGGGIFNISTTPMNQDFTNGIIRSVNTKIQGNKARAGGGIFNRGLVELLAGSAITGNSTVTTGTASAEPCMGSANCDGLGGGVLSVHAVPTQQVPVTSDARFMLQTSTLSSNTATARGGGIYSVGVLELAGNAINSNQAADGGAIYTSVPTDGAQHYCNTYGDATAGPATFNSNTASSGYSIVSGSNGGSIGFRACVFKGLKNPTQPTYMTAASNGGPNYCKAEAVDPGSRCPQPCGGLNQACCSSGSACNSNLACIEPNAGGGAFCGTP